ncbi:MAG: AAA family ATPase [Bacillota bacterium]
MDLFSYGKEKYLEKAAPLAARMRPATLEEFVGQDHIMGDGKALRRAIKEDQVSSLIFYGPPGCGKTALAKIIAGSTRAHFEQLNAVTAGVNDLRRVIREAEERLGMYRQKTIVFVDEIHRFNKAQQDALLPAVESGVIIMIGATTENPYFEVNAPLISRSRIFRFNPLEDAEISGLLERALNDRERGLGEYQASMENGALQHLVRAANGDARAALNGLELAVVTTPPGEDGYRRITVEVAADSIQQPALVYDKDGDQHYDTISAFIKSLRGSDPQAAVYWLARMIYAGEDPRFIARRMVIHAAEDVGLADPHALLVAVAAAQAVDFVGLPEARLPMAEAAIYIAMAPKSNSVCKAIDAAMRDLKEKKIGAVPVHLRDTSYRGATKMGHGRGYKYPHDFPGHYVEQRYLPEELGGVVYYQPSDQGHENKIRQRQLNVDLAGRNEPPSNKSKDK